MGIGNRKIWLLGRAKTVAPGPEIGLAFIALAANLVLCDIKAGSKVIV